MIVKKQTPSEIRIDLTGPEGNAFVILGYARQFAKAIGYTEDEIESLKEDMTSGDYENLVQVFDDHFGDFVILER